MDKKLDDVMPMVRHFLSKIKDEQEIVATCKSPGPRFITNNEEIVGLYFNDGTIKWYDSLAAKEMRIELKIDKIPEHVFEGIDKEKFLEFIKEVFKIIDNIDLINFSAAISYLKLGFSSNKFDVNSVAIMIENQCKK